VPLPPSRKGVSRRARNVVLVVTEGETERIYFNGFKRRDCNVEIKVPSSRPTDALNLVKFCINQMRQIGIDLEEGDVAICAFDILGNDAAHLEEAFCLAESEGIILALSNPCFELWYLLHFRDVDHTLNCKEAEDLLNKFIKGYRKAEDYSEILNPKQTDAIKRSSNIVRKGNITNPDDIAQTNPSISVHKAIAAIHELMEKNA
jgi:RloB-like protein